MFFVIKVLTMTMEDSLEEIRNSISANTRASSASTTSSSLKQQSSRSIVPQTALVPKKSDSMAGSGQTSMRVRFNDVICAHDISSDTAAGSNPLNQADNSLSASYLQSLGQDFDEEQLPLSKCKNVVPDMDIEVQTDGAAETCESLSSWRTSNRKRRVCVRRTRRGTLSNCSKKLSIYALMRSTQAELQMAAVGAQKIQDKVEVSEKNEQLLAHDLDF